jgi:hypothetical protein
MRLSSHPAIVLFAMCAIGACTERSPAQGETAAGASPREHPPIASAVTQACTELADHFRKAAATQVGVRPDSFAAFTGPEKRFGCVVSVHGSLGGAVTVPYLTGGLADSLGGAWTRDSVPVADGSSATAYGLRRGGVLCLLRINWKIKVRYDPKAEPSPYNVEAECQQPADGRSARLEGATLLFA